MLHWNKAPAIRSIRCVLTMFVAASTLPVLTGCHGSNIVGPTPDTITNVVPNEDRTVGLNQETATSWGKIKEKYKNGGKGDDR